MGYLYERLRPSYFYGKMWKNLELGPRRVDEGCKMSLKGHFRKIFKNKQTKTCSTELCRMFSPHSEFFQKQAVLVTAQETVHVIFGKDNTCPLPCPQSLPVLIRVLKGTEPIE